MPRGLDAALSSASSARQLAGPPRARHPPARPKDETVTIPAYPDHLGISSPTSVLLTLKFSYAFGTEKILRRAPSLRVFSLGFVAKARI